MKTILLCLLFVPLVLSVFCQQKTDEKTAVGIVDIVLAKMLIRLIALSHQQPGNNISRNSPRPPD